MKKPISRRQAIANRKEMERLRDELRRQRNSWSREWPGGTHIGSIVVSEVTVAQVSTARLLNHAVVAVVENNQLRLYALPLEKEGVG